MSEVVVFPTMTESEAERVTEQISFRIDSITENYEVVMSLMRDALARNAHEALGYPSPGAYIADRFGQSLQTLSVALRREFVHELSDAGLSTRAIAPVFGVSQKTIVKDRQVIPQVSPEPAAAPIIADGFTVNPSTGEIVDDPTIDAEPTPATTEHTFTEKVKTVTGLDGKEYRRPEPKAAPTGDEANRLNAIQASKSIGRSLEALQYLNYEKARTGIVTDWWPVGKHEVPPEQANYFTPAELRKLAQGLNETADLLEAHHVH